MTEQVGISRDWREPEERKMVKCWKCDGTGNIADDFDGEGELPCPKCDGTGEIEDDPFDRADDNRD